MPSESPPSGRGPLLRLDPRALSSPHPLPTPSARRQVLFIYIGCPPRTNLVLDDAYNDHVYGTARKSTGRSLNDVHVDCVEDKRFKQYVSKSHVVNAFMVTPTSTNQHLPPHPRRSLL